MCSGWAYTSQSGLLGHHHRVLAIGGPEIYNWNSGAAHILLQDVVNWVDRCASNALKIVRRVAIFGWSQDVLVIAASNESL